MLHPRFRQVNGGPWRAWRGYLLKLEKELHGQLDDPVVAGIQPAVPADVVGDLAEVGDVQNRDLL
jgi:hypothetical protein